MQGGSPEPDRQMDGQTENLVSNIEYDYVGNNICRFKIPEKRMILFKRDHLDFFILCNLYKLL